MLLFLPVFMSLWGTQDFKKKERKKESNQTNKAKYQPKTFQDPLPAPSPQPLPLTKTAPFSMEWQIIAIICFTPWL